MPQLSPGDYVPVAAQGDLLLYRRRGDGGAVLVALNLGAEPVSIASDAIGLAAKSCSRPFSIGRREIEEALDLRGNEGVIIGRDSRRIRRG